MFARLPEAQSGLNGHDAESERQYVKQSEQSYWAKIGTISMWLALNPLGSLRMWT